MQERYSKNFAGAKALFPELLPGYYLDYKASLLYGEIPYICSPKMKLPGSKSQTPTCNKNGIWNLIFGIFQPGCGEIGRHVRLRI